MIAFNIIFAILSFICAGICFWNPFSSALIFGYVISAFMGIWGIAAIITFIASRKNRRASGFEAAMGFIGLILGVCGVLFFIFSITIPGFTFTMEEMIIILLLVFLGIEGLLCMISALVNTSYHGVFVTVLAFIVGLIMLGGAVVGILNLQFLVPIIGLILGVAFVVNGIRLLLHCVE